MKVNSIIHKNYHGIKKRINHPICNPLVVTITSIPSFTGWWNIAAKIINELQFKSTMMTKVFVGDLASKRHTDKTIYFQFHLSHKLLFASSHCNLYSTKSFLLPNQGTLHAWSWNQEHQHQRQNQDLVPPLLLIEIYMKGMKWRSRCVLCEMKLWNEVEINITIVIMVRVLCISHMNVIISTWMLIMLHCITGDEFSPRLCWTTSSVTFAKAKWKDVFASFSWAIILF